MSTPACAEPGHRMQALDHPEPVVRPSRAQIAKLSLLLLAIRPFACDYALCLAAVSGVCARMTEGLDAALAERVAGRVTLVKNAINQSRDAATTGRRRDDLFWIKWMDLGARAHVVRHVPSGINGPSQIRRPGTPSSREAIHWLPTVLYLLRLIMYAMRLEKMRCIT